MQVLLIKKQQQITHAWSGGTTTQLCIFPPETEFKKFNFLFRMSVATVEVDETDFTYMPGVTRHLMIIKGNLHLLHKGRYEKNLGKYETDIFSGEWETHARGKVNDFNLLTREETKGSLQALRMKAGQLNEVSLSQDNFCTGIYVNAGRLLVKTGEGSINMSTGDFLQVTHDVNRIEKILIQCDQETEVVVAVVSLADKK